MHQFFHLYFSGHQMLFSLCCCSYNHVSYFGESLTCEEQMRRTESQTQEWDKE